MVTAVLTSLTQITTYNFALVQVMPHKCPDKMWPLSWAEGQNKPHFNWVLFSFKLSARFRTHSPAEDSSTWDKASWSWQNDINLPILKLQKNVANNTIYNWMVDLDSSIFPKKIIDRLKPILKLSENPPHPGTNFFFQLNHVGSSSNILDIFP